MVPVAHKLEIHLWCTDDDNNLLLVLGCKMVAVSSLEALNFRISSDVVRNKSQLESGKLKILVWFNDTLTK